MVRLYGYTYDKVRATLNYPNLWCDFQKTVLKIVNKILEKTDYITEILTIIKEEAYKAIQETQECDDCNGDKECKCNEKVNEVVREKIKNGKIIGDYPNVNLTDLINNISKDKNIVNVSSKKKVKIKETTLQNIIECLTDFKSASKKNKKNKKGFFGYECESGDLSYKNTTTIELKYIRQGDKPYEIRNALGQTLENAIVSDLKNAVLLIWDEAYSEENWDEKSEKFISMFINNPFGINFAVIRIRVYENHCTADIYL